MTDTEIILAGADKNQLVFGRFPYLLFDSANFSVIRGLGRFRREDANTPTIAGYFYRHANTMYCVFRSSKQELIFLAGKRLFLLGPSSRIEITKRKTWKRIEIFERDRLVFSHYYDTLLQYLFHPFRLVSDLFSGGGADDWDIDFFDTVRSIAAGTLALGRNI